MKKLSSISALAIAALVTVAGCLKDKGFENGEYGTQIKEVKGVAFPQSASSPVVIGVNALSTTQTIDGPIITLEQDGKAASDVQVTLQLNNALVTAAGYTVLPISAYTTTPLIVTIPAGQKTATVKITFPNSAALDPNLTYGLGFTIASVSGGYTIASNQKEIVFGFNVKNKYDGNYTLRIKTRGWAAFGISEDLPGTWPSITGGYSIGMVTGGPNSVRLYDYWGFDDFIQPAFTTGNATGTGFGATAPRFTFDLATDKLINVSNDLPDDGRGRAFLLNPAVTDSRYDPATKTIYAAYLMKQNGRPNMQIFDTLVYKSARP
ncbi:MAG: hypothetical protein JWR72_187 [Flavisolibacter sp.]|jgi:hypothetical protein|nr:hypothetical protein [Flavisolibacter sp.]